MVLHKPRDRVHSKCSILLDKVKAAYNVFTGYLRELFYMYIHVSSNLLWPIMAPERPCSLLEL